MKKPHFFILTVLTAILMPVHAFASQATTYTDEEKVALESISADLYSDEFLAKNIIKTDYVADGKKIGSYSQYRKSLTEPHVISSLTGIQTNGGLLFMMRPNDTWSGQIMKQRYAENWVANHIHDMPKTMQSIMNLYDEMTNNYTYDVNYQSAYDLIQQGKGVCYSFTRLFDEELQNMGFESYVIVGTPKDSSVKHCWNMFIYDGNEYVVDITAGVCKKSEKWKYFQKRTDKMFDGYTVTDIW